MRKKGLSKAAKKAGRAAAEGLIGVFVAPKKGAMVEVNSETDFVARNDHFQGLVKMIADVALNSGEDIEVIKAARAGTMTVAEAVSSAVATIGENITPRRAAVLSVGSGVVASYVHSQVSEGLGKIGVLVALESGGDAEALAALGRQVAMHIASSNPIALDASGVPAETIKREKDILADKFRQQGKPENMIEKITESGLKTFYKENTLLEQPFIFDDKKSVAQALKEAEGKIGGPIKVTRYVRFALGEGIEKATSDFAAEVAQQASGKPN